MGDEARTRGRGNAVTRVGASAPGKALLCGEYAVLDGAPAVVAAVDRRVVVEWSDDAQPMPPEVVATLERARARFGDVADTGYLSIDANALRRDDVKLGLGSSAAGAVASAGAVFASHGEDISDPHIVQQVFECAFEGHAAVAPSGSGVDVAASAFGGFLCFERTSDVRTRTLGRPDDLVIRLVWTGRAARTSDLVAQVRELQRNEPEAYETHMTMLATLAKSFADTFERGLAGEVVRLADEYGAAMGLSLIHI